MTGSTNAQMAVDEGPAAIAPASWAAVYASRRDNDHQVADQRQAHQHPGTMPARNSLVIDMPAVTPKRTKPIEGGITGRNDAAGGYQAGGRGSRCSRRRASSGSGARQAPPCRPWPSRTGGQRMAADGDVAEAAADVADQRHREVDDAARRPPAFMNSPARMKKGTAIKGKLSAPSISFCATICESKQPHRTHQRDAADQQANAIGMPSVIAPIREPRKTNTVMSVLTLGRCGHALAILYRNQLIVAELAFERTPHGLQDDEAHECGGEQSDPVDGGNRKARDRGQVAQVTFACSQLPIHTARSTRA